MDTFFADVTAARAAYAARKTDSSLIAWVSSEEWTDTRSYRFAPGESQHGRDFRGSVYCDQSCVVPSGTTVSGEINAYTRDHVDMFAQGEGI